MALKSWSSCLCLSGSGIYFWMADNVKPLQFFITFIYWGQRSRSEDNFLEPVFSSYCVGSRDQSRLLGLAARPLPAEPSCQPLNYFWMLLCVVQRWEKTLQREREELFVERCFSVNDGMRSCPQERMIQTQQRQMYLFIGVRCWTRGCLHPQLALYWTHNPSPEQRQIVHSNRWEGRVK